ncbi:MAG: 3-deoxy-D-manno-octulosonic acid kinase [Thiohalomonadaceae bacterium]
MKPVTRSTEKSHILYEGALLDHADDALFAPGAHAGTAVAGRGTTLFFEHGGLQLVLRHYRRGGLPARFLADRYVWTGLTRTRPWREWHLLAALHARGLPVPRPVAARAVRHGIFYRGDLITERLPAEPLSAWLRKGTLPADRWRAIGACIRRFHEAGAFHADLNAHNILLADAGAVFVIDFDRGELRAPGKWREANLRRLERSLRKLRDQDPDFCFTSEDWQSLLVGYAGG